MTETTKRTQPNSDEAKATVAAFLNYIFDWHDTKPEDVTKVTVDAGFDSYVHIDLRKPDGEKFVLKTDEDEVLARALGATDDDIVYGEVARRVSRKPVFWDLNALHAPPTE